MATSVFRGGCFGFDYYGMPGTPEEKLREAATSRSLRRQHGRNDRQTYDGKHCSSTQILNHLMVNITRMEPKGQITPKVANNYPLLPDFRARRVSLTIAHP